VNKVILEGLSVKLKNHKKFLVMIKYEKWGLTMNLEKTKYICRRRKRKFKI